MVWALLFFTVSMLFLTLALALNSLPEKTRALLFSIAAFFWVGFLVAGTIIKMKKMQ